MTLRVFPAQTSTIVVLGTGTFVLVVIHGLTYFSWPYADWAAISAETRQALSLAGPWVAACCAWTAARFTSSSGIVASPVASRMGADLVAAHLSRLGAAALVGYAAGLAPLLIRTAIEARAGAPNVLSMAGGVACLAVFVCGGYLIGSLLALRAAILTAVVAALAGVLLADVLGPAVAPVWTVGVVAGQQENPGLGVFRVLFMVLTAACCVIAATEWLARRTLPLRPRSFVPLAVMGVPLVLVLSPVNAHWVPVVHSIEPPRTCSTVAPQIEGRAQEISVCVHSARTPVLSETAAAAESVLDAAGPLARSTTRIVDVNLWAPPRPGQIVVQLQPQDSAWRQYLVEDLAFDLSGSARCAENYTADEPDREQADAVATSAGFGIWIAERAGGQAAGISTAPDAVEVAARLDALPVERVRELIAQMAPRLATCSASSSTLR